MGIDEARRYRVAAGIDTLRARRRQRDNVLVRTDGKDPVALDRNRLGNRVIRIHRNDVATRDDNVGVAGSRIVLGVRAAGQPEAQRQRRR